jgi:uncharacterized protein YacL
VIGVIARVVGLLFSLSIGGTTAYVAAQLSKLYISHYEEELQRFAYFEHVYMILFAALGMIVGFTIASLIYRQSLDLSGDVLSDLRQIPGRDKMAVVLGVFIGLGVTALLGMLLMKIPNYGPQLVLLVGIVSIYLGVAITLSMKDELSFFFPGQAQQAEAGEDAGPVLAPKLLDTNVIIDGRIADIARAGFMEGPIYVPGFVLEELHMIADSADTLRRNRGRRGLDILNQMRQEADLHVRVYDRYEVPIKSSDPVDVRLVQLAQGLDAVIVTNDFNLNKVAQLQGVRVLNVNELANAVKPVVLPGEEMVVTVVREGKEPEQGVAYLEDGTMVVVERGKSLIGRTIGITVTSVLQTVAGKMIFGHPQDDSGGSQERYDRRSRDHSGGRTRGKTA